MYRTILVPLENSRTDQAIVDHVAVLARTLGSRLVLVHVADGFAARNQKELNLAESQEMRDDRAYLQRRQDELTSQGLTVETDLACGEPATEILNSVTRHRADLIAMATHGHGFVKDVVLGSVANVVRHKTHVPVLLVRSTLST